MPRRVIVMPVLLAAMMFFVGGDAQAAPPNGPATEHDRIVRYWTPERVAHARPREVERNIPLAPLGKPAGGSNSGGGAYWSGGGLVKQTTGRVLFTLGGSDWVCSGSVATDTQANTSLVLTAGHCVYDDRANEFATNWMFVPDYETAGTFNCDVARFGCWTADALITTTAWRDSDFNEDYAFAVLGAGGKTGESLQLDSTVGAQAISFFVPQPRLIYAFGYPAARPYNGQKLAYCTGTTFADPYGSTDYGLACDMTGGASGGPWFADFDAATGAGTLTSVNSFKYRGLSKYMFGPYFDAYGQQTYNTALTASGNTLVAAP